MAAFDRKKQVEAHEAGLRRRCDTCSNTGKQHDKPCTNPKCRFRKGRK